MLQYLPLFASILGLGISGYIFQSKQKKTKLICPRESSCDHVVHSVYSNTFGVHNEILGLVYYLFQIVFWLCFTFSPNTLNTASYFVMLIATIVGAMFSIYLVGIQAFIIRSWCLWCLGSAFLNIALVASLNFFHFNGLFNMLSEQRVWWVIIHNIGFILGIGSATITDIFFFRFLKDDKIDAKEKSVMDTLTNTIWIGLALLFVSGIMLYLPNQEVLNSSSKFLSKVVVVAIITINGLLLNMFVGPKIRKLTFDNAPVPRRFRQFAFALGAISITSWYTAFLLGSFRQIKFSFQQIITTYFILIICAVIGSQIFQRILTKKFIDKQINSNPQN
jgi:uncharacterized membrane protein